MHGNFIVTFQYLNGCLQGSWRGTSHRNCRDRTRGKDFKVRHSRFRLDVRGTKHRNRLPRGILYVPSPPGFEAGLDRVLDNMFQQEGFLPWTRGLEINYF